MRQKASPPGSIGVPCLGSLKARSIDEQLAQSASNPMTA